MNPMTTTIAESITRAASKQTYYTIRFLVGRERVEDAYRAYGYFRWVDDTLDAETMTGVELGAFIQRQKSQLEKCYQGEIAWDVDIQEQMLIDLIQRDHEKDSGLQSYLRNMMQVMEFDARRSEGAKRVDYKHSCRLSAFPHQRNWHTVSFIVNFPDGFSGRGCWAGSGCSTAFALQASSIACTTVSKNFIDRASGDGYSHRVGVQIVWDEDQRLGQCPAATADPGRVIDC